MTINAHPKPAPKAKKPRRPLLSEKPIKRSNPKRRRRLFQEDFGGPEYLAVIRRMPCAVCGLQGYTIAAHLTSRGAGGKAKDVAPLCCMHFVTTPKGAMLIDGCHERYDAHDPDIRCHEKRLRKEAKERWAAWLRVSGTPE